MKNTTGWYVIVPLLATLGIAIGVLTYVYAFPGKPKIGVIDIPFTVITENSAFAIGLMLDYARENDDIEAVVIKITSPGGGAAASERLYIATRRLRDEKPVVMVMNGLVASGGYMMAMGTSHTFATPSSLVGNVGVVSSADPLLPPLPDERELFTGPHKLDGGSRRDWLAAIDQLKSSFAHIVVSERGDRLRISREELIEARLYSGVDAVKLGVADEIGAESDAFEKAAELAGISDYGLVDVNLEVQAQIFEDLRRLLDILNDGRGPDSTDALELLLTDYRTGDGLLDAYPQQEEDDLSELRAMRDYMLDRQLSTDQEDPLPDVPLDIGRPNFYYLYVGNAS